MDTWQERTSSSREAILFSAVLRRSGGRQGGVRREVFVDVRVGEEEVDSAAKLKLLLLLDKPTSGLDSQSAWAIVSFLRTLADNGQAILCTIHQPSAELFQVFDRLLLLRKGGETLYFGDLGQNATTLVDYFERNGSRSCGPDENPAEFMLDVIGARHNVWRRGYLTNPDSTSACQFRSFRTTDEFLDLSFDIKYSNRRRDVGNLITFNRWDRSRLLRAAEQVDSRAPICFRTQAQGGRLVPQLSGNWTQTEDCGVIQSPSSQPQSTRPRGISALNPWTIHFPRRFGESKVTDKFGTEDESEDVVCYWPNIHSFDNLGTSTETLTPLLPGSNMNPDAEGATPAFPEGQRDTRDLESLVPPWVTVPIFLGTVSCLTSQFDVEKAVLKSLSKQTRRTERSLSLSSSSSTSSSDLPISSHLGAGNTSEADVGQEGRAAELSVPGSLPIKTIDRSLHQTSRINPAPSRQL
ncbi:hypothetical protein BJ322DRAFT_1025521 [Thelephora terrestris]|uniref:ABC transporter family G domain-containing protein n=1 Tax=Thelephora terrestris TaxID=56493 RepID=A0A9P6H2B3_9AGAM|nr:hypothetical protein BJ322DRAFT_1025521 [Thelephora terrestris]